MRGGIFVFHLHTKARTMAQIDIPLSSMNSAAELSTWLNVDIKAHYCTDIIRPLVSCSCSGRRGVVIGKSIYWRWSHEKEDIFFTNSPFSIVFVQFPSWSWITLKSSERQCTAVVLPVLRVRQLSFGKTIQSDDAQQPDLADAELRQRWRNKNFENSKNQCLMLGKTRQIVGRADWSQSSRNLRSFESEIHMLLHDEFVRWSMFLMSRSRSKGILCRRTTVWTVPCITWYDSGCDSLEFAFHCWILPGRALRHNAISTTCKNHSTVCLFCCDISDVWMFLFGYSSRTNNCAMSVGIVFVHIVSA